MQSLTIKELYKLLELLERLKNQAGTDIEYVRYCVNEELDRIQYKG